MLIKYLGWYLSLNDNMLYLSQNDIATQFLILEDTYKVMEMVMVRLPKDG